MKVVILAGGYGTRISEETGVKPKPMVTIGHQPILWHIMKIYSAHGFHEFIICLGYKGGVIKEYFANYYLNQSSVTFDIMNNTYEIHKSPVEPWRVTLVDTGEKTMTGGRMKRVQEYIGDETFCLTYGDGLSNIDMNKLVEFHQDQGAIATLTAVQPPGRFGAFNLEEDQDIIKNFREKPTDGTAWINGGFFVIEPEVFKYIEGDSDVWEQTPMQKLSQAGKLAAYRHDGYWQNMDTLRDQQVLDAQWNSGAPEWKIW